MWYRKTCYLLQLGKILQKKLAVCFSLEKYSGVEKTCNLFQIKESKLMCDVVQKKLAICFSLGKYIGVEKTCCLLQLGKIYWCRKTLQSASACKNIMVQKNNTIGVEKTCYLLQLGRIKLVQEKLAICSSLEEKISQEKLATYCSQNEKFGVEKTCYLL